MNENFFTALRTQCCIRIQNLTEIYDLEVQNSVPLDTEWLSSVVFRFQEVCRQARLEYDQEVQQNLELHNSIAAEKAKQKYAKRYNICKDVSKKLYRLVSLEFPYVNRMIFPCFKYSTLSLDT